ncbi:hypothetical protein P3S67_011048 [Capsicum chacoense]
MVPVMKHWETLVELCKNEIKLKKVKGKHAMILYVVGESLSIGALERYIVANWNCISKVKVYYHNDGYFLVRFQTYEDRDELLYAGIHMLKNKTINDKIWTSDIDLKKNVMQTLPIWFKYPNLPLNCWGVQSLSRISSALAVPLYADDCTTQVDHISYARVLGEIDIIKTLPKQVKVSDTKGRLFKQEVIYEWVTAYCPKCLQVGHKCKIAEPVVSKPMEVTQMQYKGQPQKGEWLPRAAGNETREFSKQNPKEVPPEVPLKKPEMINITVTPKTDVE